MQARRQRDPQVRKLYYTVFFWKACFVLIYTTIVEFYFEGGDTGLYYQGIKDLRAAISADTSNLWEAIRSFKLQWDSPLFPFFYYDNYEYDLTYNYMRASSNFFVPRLGLLPSFLFFNSYLCINMCFGFFAAAGSIRLFKTFHHYYPAYWRELAAAILFLPSVMFWSSGLLKDTICFGAIGFIMYGILNVFVKRRKILSSSIWILIGGFLIFYIKVYILLALVLGIVVWLFAEMNKIIKDRTLRRVFALMTFIIAVLMGYLMINYFTSYEAAEMYSLDVLLDKSEHQREVFSYLATRNDGSYFTINTSNPVSMVFNGIVATFFRPFFWDVTSPMVLLSAIEAFIFLYLTLNFMIRRGVGKFFTIPFSDPRLLMSFVFAMVFAVAVGSSSTNFGALSRYKIPCIPFYLLMIFLLYRKTNLPYPDWLTRILGYTVYSRRKIQHEQIEPGNQSAEGLSPDNAK